MNYKETKIRALISEAAQALAEGPHAERARRDAETLLLYFLREYARDGSMAFLTIRGIKPNFNSAWLAANGDLSIPSGIIRDRFRVLVMRRRAGEPMQYITGDAEFYGLPIQVKPGVLIPRPETEHLVERVIVLAALFERPRIADIGTGSGAIAVALAHQLQDCEITATDLSGEALAVARLNAKMNAVDRRVRFLHGDLLIPIAGESFEIIVSNPPYVATMDRDSLSVEVRDYEPGLALFAGEDGLAIYRRLIPAAYAQLVPGGFLALEIGFGQQEAIRALLAESGFNEIEFLPDLQQIPRVASAIRR